MTTENATADCARSAERPTAAKPEWTTSPRLAPAAETSAALRPCATPRVSTRMLSGPGATITTSEAVRKRTKFVSAKIVKPYLRQPRTL